MKAIIFAALAAFSINASAESVNIRTELYRNGELVAKPYAITVNGSKRPFKEVQYMNFRELVGTNKARLGRLELGTTAYFTPVVTSDGDIRLIMDVNYVRLKEMKTDKFGSLTVDYPVTDGFVYKSTELLQNGGKREFISNENGDEYTYIVTATRQ
ncbi:hypothetical protein ACM79J_31390 [Pseudomonas aeruginosa]|jgi:hypothetical protein|uniref:hypothetical protein n=1 Tax=Pseudomonas sp. Marseille-P9655 TaxID=2866591 RepID=UPI001CE45813|nr:hypothetical protein [Pseudomonas sp. Marseille-P9655]